MITNKKLIMENYHNSNLLRKSKRGKNMVWFGMKKEPKRFLNKRQKKNKSKTITCDKMEWE